MSLFKVLATIATFLLGKKDTGVKESTEPLKPIPTKKSIPEEYLHPSAIIEGVDGELLTAVFDIIKNLRNQGYHAIIHNGMRTKAQAEANAKAGVGIKKSKHILGKAVDIIDSRYGWDEDYIEQIRDFRVALGKEVYKYPNLIWGGNWHKSYGALGDWAHVEI